MTEKEIINKQMRIMELLPYALGIPEMKYFDLESEKLLDEKIEVFEALKAGTPISEIPRFYEVFELIPENDLWD